MKSIFSAAFLTTIAFLACPDPAPAQGEWSPEFDQPGLGVLGVTVAALGTYRDELVAGTRKGFTSDGQAGVMNHIAHFDGVRWQPFGTGVNGAVHAVAEWQGSLYAAGSFRYAGGSPALNIARWDGTKWSAVGAGLDAEVRALVVHQNQLYAAGMFAGSGTQAAARIARFDGKQWHAVGGGIHRNRYKPEVLCLLSAGTRLYAGGSFDRAGTTAVKHIAVWDGKTWGSVGSGINPTGLHGLVESLASFGTQIIVGGHFAQAGKVAAENIAAWDGKAWSALGAGLTNATYLSVVHSLMEYGGNLYAGGTFIWVGPDTNPSSFMVPRFAKWDGTKWHAVGGVTEGLALPNFVSAMTIHDGKLWVGGDFGLVGTDLSYGKGLVSRFVASFDGKTWGAAGAGLGMDGPPRRLVFWNGGIVAVGNFTQAGNTAARSVAFFDGATWRTLGTFDKGVADAVVFGNDLVVTGNFYRVDGKVLPGGIARFDGLKWSAMGQGISLGGNALAVYKGQLYAGSTGSAKRWTGTSWQTFGTPIYGSINVMHVHGGLLYIGGSISLGTASPNLVSWDGTSLSIVGGGTDGAVGTMATYGTELVIGGRFTKVGTVSASLVARFDGKTWRQLGQGVIGRGGSVLALAERKGSLYVGGNFTTRMGNPGSWLLRFDGKSLVAVPGRGDGVVMALLVDPRLDRLYVSGGFYEAGSVPATNLTAYEFTPQFRDLGNSLSGANRTPYLEAVGVVSASRDLQFNLSSARRLSTGIFVIGLRRIDLPILGGVLVPSSDVLLTLPTDRIGRSSFGVAVPSNLPPGIQLYLQAWVLDSTGPAGYTASNAITLRSH